MQDRLRSLLAPLLVGFGAIALAMLLAYLGSEMLEGDTAVFDLRILRAALAARVTYPWLTSVARDLSGLGSVGVLTIVTAAAVGYLWLTSARVTAAVMALSVTAGSIVNSLFKTLFGRARPDAPLTEFAFSSLSFPSGRAATSAIVFVSLGALLASTRSARIERVYLLSMAATFAAVVGVSRVVLGVHWPTDVLAGWAFGCAWAMVWLVLLKLAERTRIGPRPIAS
jgi:undecaprenyl-diphosphatase